MLPRDIKKYVPEDTDTSFEIDEPDDEEVNEEVSNLEQQRNVSYKEQDEQTDSSTDRSMNSNSSTPTTADVADVGNSVEPSPVLSHLTSSSPSIRVAKPSLSLLKPTTVAATAAGAADLRQRTQPNTADDNLSASISTTITTTTADNDTDNVATSSRFAHNQHHHHHHHHDEDDDVHVQQPSKKQKKRQQREQNEQGADIFGDCVIQALNQTAMVTPLTMANHRRTHSAASYTSVSSMPYRGQRAVPDTPTTEPRSNRFICEKIRWATAHFKSSGIGEPSVHHALVVIFLEFFAWGLLAMPLISVLNTQFPDHTFLMNGIVMGIKGILSFLSAPLIGALSDIWGRKFFLLITVFFTCLPIPLMTINPWWFFATISISGLFAVTFSVVFAYVADVTTIEDRSRAYGLVSATFAASLVISPALGNALMDMYGDVLVAALGTAIAVLDVFFILVAVPESLPEKVRPSSWGAPIDWGQADPFKALRKVSTDKTILMLCLTVLLSYLPESGQYSSMFVYLKLKMGFNYMEVSLFIALVGILSITVQVTLGSFMQVFGAKRTIILGLALEIIQLTWYGFGNQKWMMWAAGVLAAFASITYPAISAFVSLHASPESQGAVQGMITGMRGLCNGLGPAMYGLIFYLFNVDLNSENFQPVEIRSDVVGNSSDDSFMSHVPGPPFLFGAICACGAILVAIFIPDAQPPNGSYDKKRVSLDVQYEIESGHKAPSSLAPLIRADSLAQL